MKAAGCSPFDVAADVVAVMADSATHPARAWARRGNGPATRLEQFNDKLLRDVAFGTVREPASRARWAKTCRCGWCSRPASMRRRNTPSPTSSTAGPFAAAGDTFSYRWNPHVFAGAGHVIAQVNYHGSSGFGHAFCHSLIGRQGELELQDIEAASDWLLDQRWADPKRLFATGGSYGGFLVAWMNGHVAPGRYRACICHAGVYDRVATFSADSWPTRPKDLAAKYWEDMQRVLAQSPHAFAANMRTPTLVIHGAMDFRVPDCNGLAYYNHAEGPRRRCTSAVVSGRRPLGAEAAQFLALVQRVRSLAGGARQGQRQAAMNSDRRLQAVILDLDGTLIDTVGDFDFALGHALADVGLPPVSREFITRSIGKGSEFLLAQTLAESGRAGIAVRRRVAALPASLPGGERTARAVYPGVVEGLNALRAGGAAAGLPDQQARRPSRIRCWR